MRCRVALIFFLAGALLVPVGCGGSPEQSIPGATPTTKPVSTSSHDSSNTTLYVEKNAGSVIIYKLTAPWDTRTFNDDTLLSGDQCPNPMGLPTQIPDRLENGGVDQKAWDALSNIHDIVILSDLAASRGNKAAAVCVLDNLYYWAQNDAFIVKKECDPSHKEHEMAAGHGYDRANFINGILAIPYLQIRNASMLDELKKTAVLSWFEKLYLCSRTRAEGMLLHAQENGLGPHNQTYPALLSVATTSLVLDKTDGLEWSIEKYQESIATVSEDGTSPNEIAHKMGWTLHYHTLIVNFSVHLSLLGEMNGFSGLFNDPSLIRLTNLVLDSYFGSRYLEELTGYEQTQNPLTTPWNLSWVEHLKRYTEDPRVGQLASRFQWKMDHSHTGGHPEHWWPDHIEPGTGLNK